MKTSQKRSIAALPLPQAPEELRERLAVELVRLEPPEPARDPGDRQPLAQGDVPVAEQRERAGGDPGDAPVLGDHRQRQALAPVGGAAPDALQEREVLGAAAQRDVLAVVGRRIGVALALGQRLHGAAERRPRLEQRHLMSAVCELERGGEPGKAAADDDRPHRAATARTLPTAESCGRRENTS